MTAKYGAVYVMCSETMSRNTSNAYPRLRLDMDKKFSENSVYFLPLTLSRVAAS